MKFSAGYQFRAEDEEPPVDIVGDSHNHME